jgi:hypothetical protein
LSYEQWFFLTGGLAFASLFVALLSMIVAIYTPSDRIRDWALGCMAASGILAVCLFVSSGLWAVTARLVM